jgi:uncharacterized protein (DUF2237 family)
MRRLVVGLGLMLGELPMAAAEDPRINVLGGGLAACCMEPKTGYARDGFCRAIDHDHGTHTVCAVVTQEFLEFSRSLGNDLISPRPEWGFPGLKPGDRWCLCAVRWREALKANHAPPVVLEATDSRTLDFVSLEDLQTHRLQKPAEVD